MKKTISVIVIMVVFVGVLVGHAGAPQPQTTISPGLSDDALLVWFPTMAKHVPLASQKVVCAIYNQESDLLGWVFPTDQIEPVVRGKRGEICVWVALGCDSKIRGIKVGLHREDKMWFDRIRAPFYRAFKDKPADGSGGEPDTVTSATISSQAMVDDVFGACKVVLNLPEVRALLENLKTER